MNRKIANNGSWVSIMCIVTGLKVVNRGALVLFLSRAIIFFSYPNHAIRYGAYGAYCAMGTGDKAAEV
jgi:hypothetical protein